MADGYLMVYHDWPEKTSALSYEEKGRLIDALVKYSRGDKNARLDMDGNEIIVFPIFAVEIDRQKKRIRTKKDNKNYEYECPAK